MTTELGAILIAEIGSVTTRVTLVDEVEGETRLIHQVEKPSTIEPPYENGTIAVLEGAAQIAEMTGRRLLQDGQLIMPQNNERDGVNHVVAASSASGTLSLIITAISSDVSARSAVHASLSTYTTILQVVTLDDYDKYQALQAESNDGTSDSGMPRTLTQTATLASSDRATLSWIERQVQPMLTLQPDTVLMAGGLEDGAGETLKRLAHIVALTTLRTTVDSSGRQRQEGTSYPVIYAGNRAAREQVCTVLEGRSETIVVDNLRPSLEQENLVPTIREIQRLYDKQVLPRLPGFAVLSNLCASPITTICNAEGLMTRFLAERDERHILTIDAGSSSSSAILASPGHYDLAVLGTCGTGYGLTTILQERDLPSLSRWLPFTMSEKDLLHWLLNKVLRPQLEPTSLEDLLLEHAVAREALFMTRAALADVCPNLQYDMVIACGGVLSHAPPGLAVLTILDALQPAAESSVMAIDLHLDTPGLLAACGTLAGMAPDAAVTMFERDVLHNTPLATSVIAVGEGKPGKVALEAELNPLYGSAQKVTVHHGEIVRLPLYPGNTAQLIVRPAPGVRIGRNPEGEEVQTDVAGINGSMLGVVIDARGRPLKLPKQSKQRCALLWEWLCALGVVKGALPYTIVEQEEAPATVSVPPVREKKERRARKKKGVEEQPLPDVSLLAPGDGQEQPQPGVPAALMGTGEVDGSQEATVQLGKRISLEELAQTLPPPASGQPDKPASGSLDNDLASLREMVNQPETKKRSLFGKKKT